MIYFTKKDLHSSKSLYIIEICGRLYPQQREYLKTNNFNRVLEIIENFEHNNVCYRVFRIDKDEIISHYYR